MLNNARESVRCQLTGSTRRDDRTGSVCSSATTSSAPTPRVRVCVLFNMIRAVVIEVYFPDLHLLGAGVTDANYNPPASIFSFCSHLQHTDGCLGSSRSSCWFLEWHQQKLCWCRTGRNSAKVQLGFYHAVKCCTNSSLQLCVGGFKAFWPMQMVHMRLVWKKIKPRINAVKCLNGLICVVFDTGLISHDLLADCQPFLYQTRGLNTMQPSQLEMYCLISLEK